MYRSLVECHFRYGDIVWRNCGETLLKKLQKIQNRAARIITGSDHDAPSEPLLLELGWRNIQELIKYDTVVMMHKSKYNLAPEYIKSFFLPNDLVHDKPLRKSKTDFRLPRMETASGQRSFSFRGAQVWNSLDKRSERRDLVGISQEETKQTVNVEGHSTLSFDLILL